jgi:hypothetical protein
MWKTYKKIHHVEKSSWLFPYLTLFCDFSKYLKPALNRFLLTFF